jgi:hypothetical protein
VARPKDGVQHPDLNKAWADYDEQIETAAKAIEQAIERELNKAAEAGDLDAALKWKTAGEQFRKDGRVPEGLDDEKAKGRPKAKPQKPDPPPQSLVVEAQVRLAKAYEAVEKSLVKGLDLEQAKQIRAERRVFFPQENEEPKVVTRPWGCIIEAGDYVLATPNTATRRAKEWDDLTIPGDAKLVWNVRLPRAGKYFVYVLYASERHRKCDLVVDGVSVNRGDMGAATGGLMRRDLKWAAFGPFAFKEQSAIEIDPRDHGPHYSRIVVSSEAYDLRGNGDLPFNPPR